MTAVPIRGGHVIIVIRQRILRGGIRCFAQWGSIQIYSIDIFADICYLYKKFE